MGSPFSRVTAVAVTAILLSLLVRINMIGCASAQPIQLFTPSGYQSYYVLGNSSMIMGDRVLAFLYSGCGKVLAL